MLMIGSSALSAPNTAHAAAFSGAGSGSVLDPYQITTPGQLAEMNNDLSGYYELRNDIDLSTYLSANGEGYHDGAGWLTIGNQNTKFSGGFDGNGYTISGLMINRPSENNQGLFGYIAASSIIQNVELLAVNVTAARNSGGLAGASNGIIQHAYTEGQVTGSSNVGGLAGANYNDQAVIKNSYSSANVTGISQVGGLIGGTYSALVTDSYAAGNVEGATDIGGLMGSNNGMVANSYATGNVTSVSDYVIDGYYEESAGGLVGSSHGAISHSYATGTVTGVASVGGLVGKSYNPMSNVYATGVVSGSSMIGGLAGTNYGTVTNAYAIGAVSGDADVGGLIGRSYGSSYISSYYDSDTTGQADSGKGDGMSTSDLQQQSTFSEWDFGAVWRIAEGDSYPEFQATDNTAPAIIRAAVEDDQPNQIVVTFDEEVTIVDATGIAVTVGGSSVSVTAADYELGTSSVTLTVSDPVDYGQEVSISYDNNTGTIADQANNHPSNFTESVINHIGKIVQFEANGGSATAFVRVAEGSMITAPAVPARTGYTFLGWYKEAGLTNEWDFSIDTVSANLTLYAKWVIPPELELGDQTGNAGDTIEVPLSLTNAEAAVAVEMDLSFDADYLTLQTDTEGIANVQFNQTADGEYRVLIGNAMKDLLPEALGYLTFTIAEDAAYQSVTTVTVSHILVSDAASMTSAAPEDQATMTVIDTVAPQLTLSTSTSEYEDNVDILLSVVETGSSITGQKWAIGAMDLASIQSGGTDFTGNSLPVMENGTYTIYVVDGAGNGSVETIEVTNYVVKGDAKNGEGQYTVDIADWQTVANFILSKETPDDRQAYAADMNDDGSIDVGDWVAIANKLISE